MNSTIHIHWLGMTYTVSPCARNWSYKVLVSPKGLPYYVEVPFESLAVEIRNLIHDRMIANNDPRNSLN